jgi:hypothetical protein
MTVTVPVRPTAADYRAFVKLPPAKGGEGGYGVRYVRLGVGQYRVACDSCRTQTGLLSWAGCQSVGIAHQCRHAREARPAPSLPASPTRPDDGYPAGY